MRLKAILDSNGFIDSYAVVVVDLDEEPLPWPDASPRLNLRGWREILVTGLTREASQHVADEWNRAH